VFPFLKLVGVDSILGPEMKSTGEVMGIDREYPAAVWKALTAAGQKLPKAGNVYVSVADQDKEVAAKLAARLARMGFGIYATKGTSAVIKDIGVEATTVYRISDQIGPDAIAVMRKGLVNMVINTPTEASGARRDGYMMRRLAVELEIPMFTTIEGASAAVMAMEHAAKNDTSVNDLASFHGRRKGPA